MRTTTEAKRKVLEAGVGGAEVEALLASAKKVFANKEVVAALTAVMNTSESKATSTTGIVVADISPLSKVIAEAKSAGFVHYRVVLPPSLPCTRLAGRKGD